MVWRQAARFRYPQAGIEQRPDDKFRGLAGVTDPIGFFGAQRFPDVLEVPREMLEVGEFALRPLPVASHFAIDAASGIQDKRSPFYTEG